MQETPSIPGVSIRRRLAVGGMAEIFLADEQLADGSTRKVVVKRLLPGAGAEEQRLFRREAVALAALSRQASPHIVGLYRAGDDHLLLEWVDGVSLQALLDHRRRRGRPLPLGAAMAIADGLAGALEALAAATDEDGRPLGLVHRDVHPGNVLLGRDGAVKLADLGVVAMTSGQPTLAGLKGTLLWMAPEQLKSGETSAASDLYSAGLVAYEAFTGQPSRPLGSLGLAELLAARSALPPPPRGLRPELPEALEAALMAALAIEPHARPAVSAWRSALLAAAAPHAPSRTELARLVAEVDARPLAVAPRTQVARAEPMAASESAPAAEPGPAAARRSRWPAIAILVAAGAIGAAIAWVAGAPTHEPEPGPLVATAALATTAPALAPLHSPGDVDDARAVDAEGPRVDVGVGAVSGGDVAAAHAAADGEAADREEADEGSARSEVQEASAPARDPEPEVALEDDRRPNRSPGDVVASGDVGRLLKVTAPGGPVHVRGGGVRGLAPWTSPPIVRGDPITLHLTGGANPMVAVVRARLKGERLVVSIGAPAGQVHRVACGGAATRETPVLDLRVPVGAAGGLPCRLEASDGRTMSFVLSDVDR